MNLIKLEKVVESKFLDRFITVVIILNAIVLGLETHSGLGQIWLERLHFVDKCFLAIFAVELFLKLITYRAAFFKDPWRTFDFLIVGISLLPASGPFSVLRSLRVLRTLRMISVVPSLRKVVSGLLLAIPGLGAVFTIICLIFYVGSVMATKLFAQDFPDWFGNIFDSAYSLCQIMTLESWSMGIVRPVMERFPMAWLFFIPFILITTFTMLNLFIAVIVNAMSLETETAAEEREEKGHEERIALQSEITELNQKLDIILKSIQAGTLGQDLRPSSNKKTHQELNRDITL
jgi:voltage-gated sodium channel